MEGEILLKIHDAYRKVIAICDKDVYGQKYIEGKKQLDLTSPFFEGEVVDADTLKEKIELGLEEDATFNVVGERSIEFCKGIGLINSEGVMKISGIPYALILL